eukprot:gene1265-32613_t
MASPVDINPWQSKPRHPRVAEAFNSRPRGLKALLRSPLLGMTVLVLTLYIVFTAQHSHAVWITADGSHKVDWVAVKEDILAIIADTAVPGSGVGEKGPTLMLHNGGSGGATIRFKEELAHGANAGLDKPVKWLEKVRSKHLVVSYADQYTSTGVVRSKHRGLSYADLYTYAGVVAIEAMGGPTIGFRAGRVDALSPDAGLRETFGRMGFNDQEIVALSGAHALGRCHAKSSGYVGPWQEVKWSPDETAAKFQYKNPSGTIMMLPSDMVLTQDIGFKKYVDMYAKDAEMFNEDFGVAFLKLIELGCKDLKPIS